MVITKRMSTLNLALMGWAVLPPVIGVILAPDLIPANTPGWVPTGCTRRTSPPGTSPCLTIGDSVCKPLLSKIGLNADDAALFAAVPDKAVFWSTDIDGKNPNPNMNAAQNWATENNAMTLEQTKAGQKLFALKLFENLPKNLRPEYDITIQNGDDAANFWNCASLYFARSTQGIVHAFASQVRVKSPYGNNIPTFYGIELPELIKKPNQKIVFHYNAINGRINDVATAGAHYTNCASYQSDILATPATVTLEQYTENSKMPYPPYGGPGDGLKEIDCPSGIKSLYPTGYGTASKGLSWVVHKWLSQPSH